MTNPTQNAFFASRQVHKDLAGVPVTITRGLVISEVVTATVGFDRQVTFEPNDNTSIYTNLRDFLINVSEYKLDSVVVAPARHDIITQIVSGVSRRFEVLDDGQEKHNYDDKDRTVWRVHTKEVT